MPPRVIRLADHVVFDVVRLEPVKELLGAAPVAAAVDMNHNPRSRAVTPAGFNAPDAGFQ